LITLKIRFFLTFAFIYLGVFSGVAAAAENSSPPPGMVLVPAGEFIMGSNKTDKADKAKEFGLSKPWYLDEHPQRTIRLPDFFMDAYEVTNAQYRDFVAKTNYWLPTQWEKNGYLLTREILGLADIAKLRNFVAETEIAPGLDVRTLNKDALLAAIEKRQKTLGNYPVTGVTWPNARDYCAWVKKRLPSEAEWEKAARGARGQEFPWGNEWDPVKLNAASADSWEDGVSPVGAYPQGKSPYGLFDMAGNVMEWVQDDYQPYPGATYKSTAFAKPNKVVRGGGWGGIGHYVIGHFYRGAYRFYLAPHSAFSDLGFRCAKDRR